MFGQRQEFGFSDSAWLLGNGSTAIFLRVFPMDFTANFRHHRRRRLYCSLPLSCAKFNLFITLHLIVFALDK